MRNTVSDLESLFKQHGSVKAVLLKYPKLQEAVDSVFGPSRGISNMQ